MNRNYKVIWNQSLNCFMAVAEYAKSRGKSSSAVVSSNAASVSNDTVTGGAQLLRLSALCVGLASAGFSMQASAIAACAEDNASGAGVVDRVQCGTGANAEGSTSVAIGQNAQATGGQTVAIGGVGGGQATTASGDQSTAIGANTVSSGSSSIAIGGDDLNKASQTNLDGTETGGAVNSGEVNTVFRKYSGDRDLVNTAPGMQYPNTESSGAASVAIGVQAVSSGALSTAFGTQANATGVASSAFGVSAEASKEGSVAIGAGSKTDGSATKVESQTVNGITFTGFDGASGFAGNAGDAGRQVSVGLIGNERQIKNVAPGEISASSTDAINGSQVFSVTNKLVDNIRGAQATADAVADGTAGIVRQDTGTGPITVGAATGGTSVDFTGTNGVRTLSGLANGNVAAGSTEAVTGDQLNTTNTNVTTAQTTANTANTTANSALTKANQGFNISAAGGTNDNVQLGESVNFTNTDSNLVVTNTVDNGINYNLADNISVSQATIGDATNNTVLTSTATGLDVGGDKITNVADGTTASDVATFGQLETTNANVTANTGNITTNSNNITTNTAGITDNSNRSVGNLSALGGNAAYDAANNTYTAPSYVLDDGTNSSTTSTFRNVGDALGNLDTRTTANTGDIATNAGNITTNTGNIADLASGRTGIVRQDTGTSPITVGAQTGGTSVDFSNSAGDDRTLTGLSAGTADNDAVNVGQLNITNNNVATNASNITDNSNRSTGNLAALGGGAAYDVATDTYTAPTYTLNNGNNDATTTDYNDVGSALGNLDTRTTTNTTDIAKGFNISAAGGTNDNVQLGESVNFTNTDGNLVVTNTVDNGINYDLADNISVTQATIGDAINNTVLTSTANGLDVGGDKITKLSNGTVVAGSSDAVTGDQLNTTNQNVAANRTDIDTNTSDIDDINAGRTGIVRQDAGTGAITVGAATGGTSVNFTGTDGVRTLSGLANGNVAAGSNDAVTGDQLNTTNTNVTANRTDIDINAGNITDNSNRSTGNLAALGGGAAYDAVTDTYTAPTYTLDDGTNTGSNTTVNNVGGALGNLDIRTTTNTTDINKGISFGNGTTDNNFALGDTINVTGDSNITSTTTANGVQVSLNESVDLGANGSFTAGNSVLNNTGLTITGGPSITSAGINAAGNKITNVDDGTDAGDAVNFGQLEASSNASDTKADALQQHSKQPRRRCNL